ncbi:hypothetical protein [Caenibius tardaugens]|uniref:hypothetical protein n=1 Tax=Caenibius tardaugens TaxID=169176 RepID=UPI00041488CE|nr:hypothetical protein [Caenibius tardaugens]AZI36526.1 hypothetical protein EGO55_11650 [Caenibius tardaugens NBRC 16725]
MSTSQRTSLRAAINERCRECIVDPLSRGSWREQVAACVSSNCALHAVRPVPRSCIVDGLICRAAVATVRERIDV